MNKGNILLMFLILVGIATASVGGYFWWTSQKPKVEPVVESKSTNKAEKWKNYTGLGISFEYPPSWGVKEYKNNPGVDDSIILSGGDVQSKSGFKINSLAIIITKGNQSVINDPLFASMCKSSGKDCVEKNIYLNGVTAIQRDYFATTPWGINKTDRQRVTTITKNGLTVFIKQERFVDNESTFLTLYDQILSTFRFAPLTTSKFLQIS